MKTIAQLLKDSSEILASETTLLLALRLGKNKAFIFAHPEYKLSIYEYITFTYWRYRYSQGIPLAYLSHHKEFFGLDFWVNKDTLIPRPDTEILVEEVLKIIDSRKKDIVYLVDVGTGSGCIPISIVKTSQNKNIKTFAIDISKNALKIAKKNAKNHNTVIQFAQGNLLEPFFKQFKNSPNPFEKNTLLIITANLPYLTPQQCKNEPSIQHEPYSALVGGQDGLYFYEELLKQLAPKIRTLPKKVELFLEIDPSQNEAIVQLMRKYFSQANIRITQDLSGRDRVVVCTITQNPSFEE